MQHKFLDEADVVHMHVGIVVCIGMGREYEQEPQMRRGCGSMLDSCLQTRASNQSAVLSRLRIQPHSSIDVGKVEYAFTADHSK